jgi:predicted DNA-binding transcriptional regulator YafY
MPKSLAASKRYVIIDECLRNDYHMPSTSANPRHRGIWPVEDLAVKIREKLDLTYPPSDRTIKEDIRVMRSGDLGYAAPINNERNVGYYYSDPDFSITNNPLSEIDIENLKEVMAILKQFKGFRYFSDVNSIISKIENTVNVSEYNRVLFDVVPEAAGLDFIEPISRAIKSRTILSVDYQPFDKPNPIQIRLHPYVLKEYNNRWFVLAYSEKDQTRWVYALDRIKNLANLNIHFEEPDTMDVHPYFKHIIGVSRPAPYTISRVVLRISRTRANYLITKPLHWSQRIIYEDKNQVSFAFDLIPNQELLAFILSLGDDCEVIEPSELRQQVSHVASAIAEKYQGL